MRQRPAVVSLLALVLARTVSADVAPVEERLRLLETRVQALEAENARLRADVAPKPGTQVGVKAAGKESEIKLGGFLQVQAEAGGRPDARFSDDRDRIYLRRARLSVAGRFLEEVEWRTEVELSGSVANASSLRGQLTDAYVSWRRWEALEVRAGQFKTPFGFEHLYSDQRLAFTDRALGSDRLTLGRQPGVQVGGSVADRRLSWLLGAFNGTGANASGNDDDRFLLAARVSGVPVAWRIGKREAKWTLGLSAYRSTDAAVSLAPEFQFDSDPSRPGIDNVLAGRRRAFGADTQVLLGPVELWGEWLEADFSPDNLLPSAAFGSRGRAAQATVSTLGERLLLGVRWDDFDPNGSLGGDESSTWSTGVTWLIRGHDLKLQTTWMDVHGPLPDGDESKLVVRFQLGF